MHFQDDEKNYSPSLNFRDLPVSDLLGMDLQMIATLSSFYVGVKDFNFAPHTHVISTLTTNNQVSSRIAQE